MKENGLKRKMSRHTARNLGPLKLTPLCLPLQNFVGAFVGILTARHVALSNHIPKGW